MKLPTLGVALALLVGPGIAVADDLADAVQSLKDAAAKNNISEVKKLAASIRPMASKMASEPAPAGAEEKKAWAERVANAKKAQETADGVIVSTAIGSDPDVLVDLIATLEKESPKSKALDGAYGAYMAALDKGADKAKAPAIAEKALVNFPENDDLLFYTTQNAVTKRLNDRALALANRLTAAVTKRVKPEGVADEDWKTICDAELSYGYYIAGWLSAEKGQNVAADKNLRAALPLIQEQPAYLGPALFYLGLANGKLGEAAGSKARVMEGLKFLEQAKEIAGPHQEQARKYEAILKEAASHLK